MEEAGSSISLTAATGPPVVDSALGCSLLSGPAPAALRPGGEAGLDRPPAAGDTRLLSGYWSALSMPVATTRSTRIASFEGLVDHRRRRCWLPRRLPGRIRLGGSSTSCSVRSLPRVDRIQNASSSFQ